MDLAEKVSGLKLINIVQEKGRRLVEDRKKERKMYCTTNDHAFAESLCKWN
jgi:hypothetical protein